MSETYFPYKFCASEPGIFAEIYLPKKAKFQGTLYNALTKAIKTPKILKDYFIKHKDEISELMKINNSLEAKFPSKESGSYKKLRYSAGGFTKGDKLAFLGFGIVGVIIKRALQKIGRLFRKSKR